MKIYRSIEFSKLIFLVGEEYQFLWEEFQNKRDEMTGAHRLHRNWWMNDVFADERRQIISAVIRDSHKAFFSKSMELNAMSGGRFNPERSFGVLYSANNSFVSALEVLYHKFIDLLPVYNDMQSNRDQIHSALDVEIPEHLNILVVSFEFTIDSNVNLLSLNEDHSTLKEICEKVGFRRYTRKNFDRDFIFGNDYEISRHLGSYIHSGDHDGFTVPSARISFDVQDELSLRNTILFEHKHDACKPLLSGNFQEFNCAIDLTRSDGDGMDVIVKGTGSSDRQVSFKLQPTPTSKKDSHPQVRIYMPDSSEKGSHARIVQLQKYFVAKKK